MKEKIFSIIEKLSLRPTVGGLEISDSSLRFLCFRGEKKITASLRLPPGIIQDGKINDRQNLSSLLKNLRSQITSKKRRGQKIQIVVSLPASVVYSQSFIVPEVNTEGLAETIELNLRMISPVDLEKSYSDWQIIGNNTNQKEILGVFAEKTIVDQYDQILRENGFLPVAFEFPALSLSRIIKDLGPNLDPTKPYLIIDVTTDGLNFLIVKNGELYFNHFFFWNILQGEKKQIALSDFKNILIQEIQKVINFGLTNLRENFGGTIIITSALQQEIEQIIKNDFGLEIIPLQLKRYTDFQNTWFVALGLALRGLIPRRQDNFISLSGYNVIEEFYHKQTLSFIAFWRNIFAVSFLIFLLVFGNLDWFFSKIEKNMENQISSLNISSQAQEINELQTKAQNFNQLVALITTAKQNSQKWSPFLEQLNNLASSSITIDRILIQSLTTPVRLQGRANDEKTVINFKGILAKQLNITNVNLPLTNIQAAPDRRVSFELFFTIKSLTP